MGDSVADGAKSWGDASSHGVTAAPLTVEPELGYRCVGNSSDKMPERSYGASIYVPGLPWAAVGDGCSGEPGRRADVSERVTEEAVGDLALVLAVPVARLVIRRRYPMPRL